MSYCNGACAETFLLRVIEKWKHFDDDSWLNFYPRSRKPSADSRVTGPPQRRDCLHMISIFFLQAARWKLNMQAVLMVYLLCVSMRMRPISDDNFPMTKGREWWWNCSSGKYLWLLTRFRCRIKHNLTFIDCSLWKGGLVWTFFVVIPLGVFFFTT